MITRSLPLVAASAHTGIPHPAPRDLVGVGELSGSFLDARVVIPVAFQLGDTGADPLPAAAGEEHEQHEGKAAHDRAPSTVEVGR